ncbi:MAG: hypothetical protein ACYTG7_09475 [Planctomycetota bacterium]|jgi:asparagine N-glycosylation enzyme membrane subunit Stt3
MARQQERDEPSGLPPDTHRTWRACLAWAIAAGLLFLFIQYLKMPEVVQDGKVYFTDPDAYTWLDRTKRILEEPGIYVHDDPLDNFPFGYTPHWTQPLHWCLAVLTKVFTLFGGGEAALEWAGLWIGPLFGSLLAAILAFWAFRCWSWPISVLTLLIFLVNPYTLATFALGRPDHQCLIFPALMMGVLLLLDRKAASRYSTRQLVASGLCIALGVWVSVQALGIWALLCAILILRSAFAAPGDRSQTLKDALLWTAAAAAAGMLFFLLEGRPGFFRIVTDSISLGHVILLAMPAAGLLITRRILRRRENLEKQRWLLAAVLPPALLSLAAILWLWQCQKSAHDPEILAAMGRWFASNSEFIPAVFSVDGDLGLGRLHSSLAYTLYSMPFLLFALWKTRLLSPTARSILAAGLLIGSLLTLWQMRWRDIHALLIAPVLAVSLWEWLHMWRPAARLKAPMALGLAAAISVLLLFPWLEITGRSLSGKIEPSGQYKALRHISEWIRENDPLRPGETDPAVMTVWDEGPMIRYWSGRPVVAGPYHRNMEGILDTMMAYTARTDKAFARYAEKRKVRYLIRPPLEDANYHLYTFEHVAGKEDPAIYIRTRQITADGKGIVRGYDLCPGMTPAQVETILRFRLESNRWEGWDNLVPVRIPGLDRILADAEAIPYLYRVKITP